MTIQFENTRNHAHATRWYSIEGADPIEYKVWSLAPISAKFDFIDGKFCGVEVRGCVVLKNGMLSTRFMEIVSIHMYNQEKWPDWMKRLRDFAITEFKYNIKVNGNKITNSEAVKVA